MSTCAKAIFQHLAASTFISWFSFQILMATSGGFLLLGIFYPFSEYINKNHEILNIKQKQLF
jgi:hypothetical protein